MFTLYGDLGSGAFSAEAALAEAGAPYAFELVSLEKNEQRQPAFLAINPSGKMPALRLGEGLVITESAAILLTIADNFPQARLLPPQGSAERALAYRWLLFMAGEIYPFVEMIDYPERFAPEGADAIKAVARARVRERLLLVERIATGPFILAGGFSLLDIYAAMFSRWKGALGREWRDANLPLLGALSQKVAQRPAIAPVWNRHFAGN
jgi:GST-like protein